MSTLMTAAAPGRGEGGCYHHHHQRHCYDYSQADSGFLASEPRLLGLRLPPLEREQEGTEGDGN